MIAAWPSWLCAFVSRGICVASGTHARDGPRSTARDGPPSTAPQQGTMDAWNDRQSREWASTHRAHTRTHHGRTEAKSMALIIFLGEGVGLCMCSI